jgi:hypothetical protein
MLRVHPDIRLILDTMLARCALVSRILLCACMFLSAVADPGEARQLRGTHDVSQSWQAASQQSTAPGRGPEEATRMARIVRTAPFAVLGSFGGAVAGSHIGGISGERLGEGYAGASLGIVVGGLVGGTLVSASAAHVLGARTERSSFRRALTGAAIGIVPGLLVGAFAESRYDSFYPTLAGFAIGQGITAAIVTAR